MESSLSLTFAWDSNSSLTGNLPVFRFTIGGEISGQIHFLSAKYVHFSFRTPCCDAKYSYRIRNGCTSCYKSFGQSEGLYNSLENKVESLTNLITKSLEHRLSLDPLTALITSSAIAEKFEYFAEALSTNPAIANFPENYCEVTIGQIAKIEGPAKDLANSFTCEIFTLTEVKNYG